MILLFDALLNIDSDAYGEGKSRTSRYNIKVQQSKAITKLPASSLSGGSLVSSRLIDRVASMIYSTTFAIKKALCFSTRTESCNDTSKLTSQTGPHITSTDQASTENKQSVYILIEVKVQQDKA